MGKPCFYRKNFTLSSGTPAASPQGDEWLIPTISGSNKPMSAIVVIVPAAIGTPHPTYNSTVTGTNRVLDGTTSPATTGLSSGDVWLVTEYDYFMTMQVVDQFGVNLDQLYAGAPISETINFQVVAINQNLTASGTYSDPVGKDMPRDNGPSAVPAGSTDALQWVLVSNTYRVALITINPTTQNIPVSVAGISLNPGVVGRVVSTTSPNSLTITWPN
jgi:hypothetical protein